MGGAHDHVDDSHGDGDDGEDLITRTLSGDVAPRDPIDETGPPGPAG
jgi:hypothetical protein